MTDTPALAERNREQPPWLGHLRDFKLLEWSAVSGLLVALLIFFGYIADNGKRAALGIDFLDRPPISPNYIMRGIAALATSGLLIAVLASFLVLVMKAFSWGVKETIRLSSYQAKRNLGFVHKKTPMWIWALLLVLGAMTTSIYAASIQRDVLVDIDSTLLKPTKEIANIWVRMGLGGPGLGYWLRLCCAIPIFVALSWRALWSYPTSKLFKCLWGAWSFLQTFLLAVTLTYIQGAMASFHSYPIVTFSNMEPFGKNVISVLLDSDDKGYAFLLLGGGTPDFKSIPRKLVLYVPRTEIKAFTVLSAEPLYDIIRANELRTPPPASQANPGPMSGTPAK